MADHAILTSEAHRDLRVRTDRSAALGDDVMYSLIVPDEFRRVQAEYPILFRSMRSATAFTALAMFGFEAGENLFLEGNRWDAAYRPLAVECQPFLIGRTADGEGQHQVHIDTVSPRIATHEGVRVFEEDGRPTPYLEGIAETLGLLDEGYQASGDFFLALSRYELLEPLTLDVGLDDGSTNRLVGFHAINEDRLRELDAATLGRLHADDHLMPIFMALASLGQLGKLIARKNRKVRHG